MPQQKLLPTSLVGSYAQPEWLIDRAKLAGRFPPRVRARELWRVAPEFLEEAQDDATILAIRDQERAGLDIITDGEHAPRKLFQPLRHRARRRRHRQSRHRARPQRPSQAGAARHRQDQPPARRRGATTWSSCRANTDRAIKMTVPGPFTMSQQAQNDFYDDPAEMALDYAAAVNEEIKDLFAAGADVVQIDEPYMQARPEQGPPVRPRRARTRARRRRRRRPRCTSASAMPPSSTSGPRAIPSCPSSPAAPASSISIETAQSNLDCTVLETLPDKTIILGVLDLSTHEVETPETVAARIRRALPHVDAERIVVAPDCGLKYLPRDVAFGKMKAMADGAAIVRAELG